MSVPNATVAPVRKSVTVKTGVDRAFSVFTDGIDTWWPRSHHIGKGTLEKTVIEPRLGGRCYGRTTDGVETDWGKVLAWEPPQRFVVAWMITPEWHCQPDVSKSSEVEVRFTALDAGTTRVDLEHRHFERHGAGAETMRNGVDAPNGWSGLLGGYASQVQGSAPNAEPPLPDADSLAAPMAYIFRLNTGLMSRAIDGLTDEQAWTRPTPQTNAMLWIIAHAVTVRASMLKMLGVTVDTGWGDLFARGATPRDTEAYPDRDEILRVHATVAAQLATTLASLTPTDLVKEIPNSRFPGAKTMADQIAFLALHDSYHVGQLGYIRKELGFGGMVG
jgi:uncharacterized protein YndB with AHSA1/START domain/uncharacterized damage-inducible protein DinB